MFRCRTVPLRPSSDSVLTLTSSSPSSPSAPSSPPPRRAGIPLAAFALLWRFRARIVRGDPLATGALGFLFAGYATTRGGLVIAWEVLVMVRKLCIVVLGIVQLSATVQVLCAILLLFTSVVVQINVRPYETRWLNLLDEGSLIALVLTQTISLVYLDLDARAVTATERSAWTHKAAEIVVTVVLLALNALAFATLILALAVAACRHYGPNVGCCKPERRCARFVAKILDEEWRAVMMSCDDFELVWQNAAGALVATPRGVVLKWRNTASGALTDPSTVEGRVQPPPIGRELLCCDEAGAAYDLGGTAPMWRNAEHGAIVPLSEVPRSRVAWRNERTGAVAFIDPRATRAAAALALPALPAEGGDDIDAAAAALRLDDDADAAPQLPVPPPAPEAEAAEEAVPIPYFSDPGPAIQMTTMRRQSRTTIQLDALFEEDDGAAAAAAGQRSSIQVDTINPFNAVREGRFEAAGELVRGEL